MGTRGLIRKQTWHLPPMGALTRQGEELVTEVSSQGCCHRDRRSDTDVEPVEDLRWFSKARTFQRTTSK